MEILLLTKYNFTQTIDNIFHFIKSLFTDNIFGGIVIFACLLGIAYFFISNSAKK